jgi:general stress protein YciG
MGSTYYIYHIYGYKFGCTKNLESRIQDYLILGYLREEIEVFEILSNSSEQKAGDREKELNIQFGYNPGQHYVIAMNARRAGGKIGGRRRAEILTHEEMSEIGRKAGQRIVELGIGVCGLTLEQRIKNGSKGGKIRVGNQTTEQRSEIARMGGFVTGNIRGRCPHCGLESNIGNLRQWHFDKCNRRVR